MALCCAVHVCAAYGLPMLGVKMGGWAFAEVMPDDWQRPLKELLEGRYWIEERLMVGKS